MGLSGAISFGERIAGILNAPPLVVTLNRPPLDEDARADIAPPARMFSALLRAALGGDRAVRVAVRDGPSGVRPGPGACAREPVGCAHSNSAQSTSGRRRSACIRGVYPTVILPLIRGVR